MDGIVKRIVFQLILMVFRWMMDHGDGWWRWIMAMDDGNGSWRWMTVMDGDDVAIGSIDGYVCRPGVSRAAIIILQQRVGTPVHT